MTQSTPVCGSRDRLIRRLHHVPPFSMNTTTKSRGKKYRSAAEKIEQGKSYEAAEAMKLLTEVGISKFDATAELHIRINADTTKADQLVRTTVVLPHGTGKTVKIAAFVPDDHKEEALKAGAVKAGNEDLIADVAAGNIDFDIAIAMPQVMKDLGKIAKTLGQKGLMPNPKAGTVTDNISKTIGELSKGRIECKMDKNGIIHVPFGKLSFGADKLKENYDAIMQSIEEAKPAGIKGTYITSLTIAPTMGPGIKLATSAAAA